MCIVIYFGRFHSFHGCAVIFPVISVLARLRSSFLRSSFLDIFSLLLFFLD
jgi:uncharacterized membrane protein